MLLAARIVLPPLASASRRRTLDSTRRRSRSAGGQRPGPWSRGGSRCSCSAASGGAWRRSPTRSGARCTSTAAPWPISRPSSAAAARRARCSRTWSHAISSRSTATTSGCSRCPSSPIRPLRRRPVRRYPALARTGTLSALAPSEGLFGATARALGVLATALSRYDDAERHLATALDIEQRMAARPWLAHAQHDLAAMFVARGEPDRARPHLDDAVNAHGELGMETSAAGVRPGINRAFTAFWSERLPSRSKLTLDEPHKAAPKRRRAR
jgi:Tetratricopeptide repeat